MMQGIRPLMVAAILWATITAPVMAQRDAAAIAKRIAPIATAHLVVRFDIQRLNINRLADDVVVQLAPAEHSKAIRDRVVQLANVLKAKNVSELYIAIRMSDVPKPGPIMVIPVASDEAAASLQSDLMTMLPFNKSKVVDWSGAKVLVVGEGDAVNGLGAWEQPSPAAMEQLTEGFQAVGRHSIQAVCRISADERRVINEIFHVIPQEVGGGPIGDVVDGFQWFAIGASVSPNAAADAIAMYDNQAAATRSRDRILKGISIAADNKEWRKAWPHLEKLPTAFELKVQGNQIAMKWSEGSRKLNSLLGAFTMPLERARSAQRRAESMNDLKHIALAMHNHYSVYRKFPAVASRDDSGRKLLSWRVHLLPFLEQQQLYQEFKLDEPWDSEHNKKLISKMPKVFLTPGSKLKLVQGRSTYRLPSSKNTVFPPDGDAKTFRQILDGTSNTMMAVEVDDEHSVIWTKPEGLKVDPKRPHAGFGGHFDDVFLISMCDGSVRAVKLSISAEMLNRLLEAADGQVVEIP